ncbi:MAG: radical SAM protein [bacterium]|nr:radical SAM protein [bacterium]
MRGPIVVLWNYGHWCNMACLHCYSRPDAHVAEKDLSSEDASRIVAQLIDADVMHVHFGGGEPLGRKDFLSNAQRLVKAGISVTLSTNGSLLTETVADQLAALPIDTVAFSIHGSNEESHDRFNNFPGAWGRLILAIQHMVTRNVKVKLVMTLTKQTAPHGPCLLDLTDRWGVNKVQFQTFKQYGNASLHLLSLNMTRMQWRKTFQAIEVARTRLANAGSKLNVDLGLDEDPSLASEIGLSSVQEKCICGIHSITLKPNGDIVACSFAPRVIGNVHQQSLIDLWRNSPVLRRIRKGGGNPCMD